MATELGIDPSGKSFATEGRSMLIGGDWVQSHSGRTLETVDPATGEPLATVPRGDSEDIDRAVKTARAAFEDGEWPRMAPAARGRLLHRIGDLILEHGDELATLETLDNGKPLTVARAADVPLSADGFHYMSGWATKIMGSTITPSVEFMPGAEWHAYTLREPVGVAGQIIPWNAPLLLAAWKLAPALACGCTVVLKPAEETPLSALRLAELMLEAGLPPGVLNVVTGFGEEAGAPLAAHPDVDKIAFTGSAGVGRLIVGAAAKNLKKVSLELGGKSPNVVFMDADLKTAIPGAANAIFLNAGQACCAGSRLFAQEKVYDDVVSGVAEAARSIKLGPGSEPQTEMGPLVSQTQLERVCGYLQAGESEGAETVTGGRRHGERGYFVEPTVLANTNPKMRVEAEEIFGPVVTVRPFKSEEELIAEANATEYGLAAGVWTRDISKAHRTAKRLRAGTVWINTYNVLDSALPFGGYKASGWGRELGAEALELYTEVKAVLAQL
jgi:phenylacetaldehyde dehydrogenase